MREYRLVCSACGAVFDDDGSRLQCSNAHGPALLRSAYAQRAFTVSSENSILRYGAWLPSARNIATSARTAVYRSTALGSHLGLRQLWVAFSGWWPERGATLPTGTFKDLEAVSVLRRLDPADKRTLVISSAGNTALAFARVCSENAVPALIIVPLRAWEDVMSSMPTGPLVQVVAIADAGYDEAIAFAREVCAGDAFILEGGVRNIGRRDGMGTAMLAAVEALGALPDYYFQAVGSAAGALAAHEAASRVIADGRFGTRLPRLMLSQNRPFTPIHDAWEAHSPTLLARSQEVAQRQLARIGAFVLSNASPPYAIPGGVRAALEDSHGRTFAITTGQMGNAMSLFSELEGASIEPAAGVAVASLIAAAKSGQVAADDRILLHVTGGGRPALPTPTVCARCPALVVDRAELATTALDRTRSLLR
jgi:cysteate synthase